MFYSKTITVPANTARGAFPDTRIYLMHGVITKVIFRPRPGHHALCHCQVYHRRHQIFPSSSDDDLHGDVFPIEWEEWYEVPEKPFYLEIVAWNDDILYPHTFDIAFACIPRWATVPYAMAKAITEIVGLLSPKRIFTRSK
ncbi:MAG: hypothetical protein HWN68_10950 [Desulfobacterales bacterium]|nr:hypothetical protein [Desulfobacterales bacterium]